MLSTFKAIIEKSIAGHKLVALEEFEFLGEEKAAFTFSSEHLMGSIEILKDLTADLLIIEFENENILYSMTFENIKNIEELSDVITDFLKKLEDCERKYLQK
jgi:hypothetical protein